MRTTATAFKITTMKFIEKAARPKSFILAKYHLNCSKRLKYVAHPNLNLPQSL